MSRIGKMPIFIPENVEISINDLEVSVKGPKGILSRKLPVGVKLEREGHNLMVKRISDSHYHKSIHGLTRSLINNMVKGVTEGFSKVLDIQGVGYRIQKKGEGIELLMGFSHPTIISKTDGIEIEIISPTRFAVKGIDKELVGEVAANIRSIRKPEPYKGKGIRYQNERVRKKAGKAGK